MVKVPGSDDFEALARFPRDLHALAVEGGYELDFSGVAFIRPAWLVIVGGALRTLKREHPELKRRAVNYKHLSYAARMGFFRYFGLDYGSAPASAPGSDTYAPLTELFTAEVRRKAALAFVPVGEAVHAEAETLASLLTRQSTGELQDTLAYAVREIVRNVVEHSEGESCTFAAQYWPARDEVEVVVSDQGCGLVASLRENPRLEIASDEDALRLAVQPGVSSKAWRRGRHNDEWANSGYGLFMTERLCGAGGSFELMSGSGLLRISPAGTRTAETRWPGTLVVLRLNTANLGALNETLSRLRDEGWRLERGIDSAAGQGPSRASQSAKPPKPGEPT